MPITIRFLSGFGFLRKSIPYFPRIKKNAAILHIIKMMFIHDQSDITEIKSGRKNGMINNKSITLLQKCFFSLF